MDKRTQIQRLPQRQTAAPAVLHGVLDEGLVCHVAYVADDG
jgi:hypothetical protein